MQFSYANVPLEVVKVNDFQRVYRWSGTDYAGSTYRVRVLGWYNPSATAYNFQGAQAVAVPLGRGYVAAATQPGRSLGPPVPTNQPLLRAGQTAQQPPAGVPGPLTEAALKAALSSPRQKLVVSGFAPVNGTTVNQAILVSPSIDPTKTDGSLLPCDLEGGPFPVVNSIVSFGGGKSFLVDFTVETTVYESDVHQLAAALSPLLSLRYVATHDIDQDGFTTRTVVGRAIFRADLLAKLGRNADDYRSSVIPPVPFSAGGVWKRAIQKVWHSEDGVRLNYLVVDRQMYVGLSSQAQAAGVTRIEAFMRREIGTAGFEGTLTSGAGLGLATAGRMSAANTAAATLGRPTPFTHGQIIGWGAAFGSLTALQVGAPKCRYSLVCRVWGNPAASRRSLAAIAMQAFKVKILQPSFLNTLVGGQVALAINEDLMGPFVELVGTRELGPVTSTLGGIGQAFGLVNMNLDVDQDPSIPGITDFGGRWPHVSNDPVPGTQDGTRGTYTGGLKAAPFLQPGQSPSPPADPPSAVPQALPVQAGGVGIPLP